MNLRNEMKTVHVYTVGKALLSLLVTIGRLLSLFLFVTRTLGAVAMMAGPVGRVTFLRLTKTPIH